jgi:hypothetical protein
MKDVRELFTWQDQQQKLLAITLWQRLDMDINKDDRAQHDA